MAKTPRDVPETPAPTAKVASALVAEVGLYRATPDQHLIRARLHMELRDNPSISVNDLTTGQIASICRDSRVITWMRKNPDFRRWLRAPRDTEERVEAAYSQFVEDLEFRRAGMSDKDFLNALKLLAELGSKVPKKWENTKILDADVSKMSDDDRVRLMADTLKRMGFVVTPPPALAESVDVGTAARYDSGAGGDPGAASERVAGQSESPSPVPTPIDYSDDDTREE